jgi:hypothetical protein
MDGDYRAYHSLTDALLGCLKHGLIFYSVLEEHPETPKLRVWGLSPIAGTLQWQAEKRIYLLNSHQLGADGRVNPIRISTLLDTVHPRLPLAEKEK